MASELKAFCSKHGDVTEGAIRIEYETIDPEKKERTIHRNVFCIECINELLTEFQQQGKIGTIEIREYENAAKDDGGIEN
jgi:hypothetical protein